MSPLAWLRRLAVSFGIGLTSYIIMLGIMVVSVLFDQQTAALHQVGIRRRAGHCFEISIRWYRAAIGARWR